MFCFMIKSLIWKGLIFSIWDNFAVGAKINGYKNGGNRFCIEP